jgi:hypothetical protein
MAPVLKAAYVVRCFDGDSRRTGEDLKTAMRDVFGPAARTLLLPVLLALAAAGPAAAAEPAPGPAGAAPARVAIDPRALDDAIARVLERPRFAWRLPAAPPVERSTTIAGRFLDAVFDTLDGWWRSIRRVIERAVRWLERWMRRITPPPAAPGDTAWPRAARWLTGILLALALAGLALVAWRARRPRGALLAVAAPAPAAADPGVDDSEAAATAPEDWIGMARGFAERGETRLAARAAYLAMLSHLGNRGLLTLQRAKSNLEYRRELARRARGRPEIPDLFAECVGLFEPVWYGRRAADPGLVETLAARYEAMRAHAPGS